MAGKVHLPAGFMEINFRHYYKTTPSPKGRIRCLAMLHLQRGKSVSEAAQMVQHSRAALHAWLGCLRERGGLERLVGFVQGRGRKRKLSGVSEEELKRAILRLSEKREGGRMTGRDVQRLIRERWQVDYRLPSIYVILKRLKLVWVTARSKHPQMDAHRQEHFKKTSLRK